MGAELCKAAHPTVLRVTDCEDKCNKQADIVIKTEVGRPVFSPVYSRVLGEPDSSASHVSICSIGLYLLLLHLTPSFLHASNPPTVNFPHLSFSLKLTLGGLKFSALSGGRVLCAGL